MIYIILDYIISFLVTIQPGGWALSFGRRLYVKIDAQGTDHVDYQFYLFWTSGRVWAGKKKTSGLKLLVGIDLLPSRFRDSGLNHLAKRPHLVQTSMLHQKLAVPTA